MKMIAPHNVRTGAVKFRSLMRMEFDDFLFHSIDYIHNIVISYDRFI